MRFDRDTEMAKALRVDHRPALDETIDPTHPVIASPWVGAMRRPRTGSAKQSRASHAQPIEIASSLSLLAMTRGTVSPYFLVRPEMRLSQLYATSTRICQSGTPISNRECGGKADGPFYPGSWK
jgi:hypothetical protein